MVIFREIMAPVSACENAVLLITAFRVDADRLLDESAIMQAGRQELISMTVKFEPEPMYTQEQFDAVLTWWSPPEDC